MSKSFPQFVDRIGGVWPVETEKVIQKANLKECNDIFDFGLGLEQFITDTICSLREVSSQQLADAGIEWEESRWTGDSPSTTVRLKMIGTDGNSYEMSGMFLKDCEMPLEVRAHQQGSEVSIFPGLGHSKKIFSFEKKSAHVAGDYFERKVSFSTEETSYSGGERSVTGGYVSAACLHPDTKIAYSHEEGSYVIDYKSASEKPVCREDKYYRTDGTVFEQELFGCTTYGGFGVALDDAKSKVKVFEQAWSDVLVKLGLEAPKSPLVKCRNN